MQRLVVLMLCMLIGPCQFVAQDAQWSISAGGGWNIAASESMQGTTGEVAQDASDDYVTRRYPYHAPTLALGLDLRLQHIISDRVSWYGGVSADLWANDDGTFYAYMQRYGIEAGARFRVIDLTPWLAAYIDAGITANLFTGRIDIDMWVFQATTTITPALRGGARAQAGLTASIPNSPFDVSIMAGYHHANLIGASFDAPASRPNTLLNESALNDGKNPNDPGDDGRAIAAWTMRLMVGWRW